MHSNFIYQVGIKTLIFLHRHEVRITEIKSDTYLLVEMTELRFDLLARLQTYPEGRWGRSVEVIRKRKGWSDRLLKRVVKDITMETIIFYT